MAVGHLGDHAQAVEAAEGLRFPRSWLPTRIGHHYHDLARTHRWLQQPGDAMAALQNARRVAPGQARRHPLTRDTITALLRTQRHSPTPLTEYAAWVSV